MKTNRVVLVGMTLLSLVASVGCESIKSRFSRQALPDLGPPVPLTVQLDIDPSLAKAKTEYIDNCSRIHVFSIGPTVEDTLIQAAHQTFRSVAVAGSQAAGGKPDVTIRVRMLDPRFKLQTDALYDRAPAELSLDALAEFFDASGAPLGERPLQATRKERLQLELTQQRCDYVVDPLLQDTSTMLATQFMQEARVLLAPATPPPAAGAIATPAEAASKAAAIPAAPASAPAQPLSFKATLLDENGNLLIESGERIRVRVDVVNTGAQTIQDSTVRLTGPQTLLAQFPATTLATGAIPATGSKSLEFIATMPQSPALQRAELQVALLNSSGQPAAPSQTLPISFQPTAALLEDVDHIPAATAGAQRPGDYLLAIGLSSYREQEIAARKYASLDAETVAAYFQTLGGLPQNNVRLLRDWSALRPDIEEALLDWLPAKTTKDSLVVVYFAGQAMVNASGETFLIPYDGSMGSPTRLYPLKELEAALGRLKAKQVLFVFDGTVLKNGADGRAKAAVPKWIATPGPVLHMIATTGFGRSLESDTWHHGLFTYYFLRGLRGEADVNRNGEVTIAELTAYLNRKVPGVARSTFKQEQQPQILPTPRGSEKNLDTVLTKPAMMFPPDQP
ncbi:MAG TPA: hypothetical protein PK866_12970 [Nitrospira sp.]|nr:hypothetical protein [Nitrospira sp.]